MLNNINEKKRIHWLDNLRTFMIFLVVIIHVATVYEKYSMGEKWWLVVDPSQSDFYGILFLILNIFVMPTMFFISGYLAPVSLKNKLYLEFIKAKFNRLIIPWALAVVTVVPLFKVIFLYSRSLPQENWTTYFHWSNGIFSQLWLWFLPVLFLFEIIYLVYAKIYTLKISLKNFIFIVFSLSLINVFIIRYFDLLGWTKNPIINFENERLLVYFLIFLLGSQFSKLKVFDTFVKNKKIDSIIHAIGWIPVNLYIGGVIFTLVNPGKYLISKAVDIFFIRMFLMLSISYLLYTSVTVFKWYFDKTNRLIRELNNNSYNLYIIHVIVMGIFGLMMMDLRVPYLLKFLFLIILTFIISNFLVSVYRRFKTKILKTDLYEI